MEPYHASSKALITAENNIARFYSQKNSFLVPGEAGGLSRFWGISKSSGLIKKKGKKNETEIP
jgi:hypothetical protein